MPSISWLDELFPTSDAVPEAARISMPFEQREYLIDGQIRKWQGELQEIRSCVCWSDGEPALLGHYPLLNEAEAMAALDAANRAYDRGLGAWPTMSVGDRIRHVEDFAWRMKGVREEVVRRLMWEIGKTRPDAEKEFDRTLDYIADTIDALKDLDRIGSRFAIESGIIAQIRRAPLGTVLCMGPYNYPLNETFTTLIPALIMGNTVIFKPAKHGVLLLAPLLEAFRDAFPPGVVNTVYGDGRTVVGPLMQSGRVDCLAFIGSSKVADVLKHQHPQPHRLRCVLGLDAKNAGIVLPCADLDVAVSESVLGSLSYNGQRCTALKILFVHRSLVDSFLERFVAAVDALRPGMPWQPNAKLTPLPVPGKPAELAAWVKDAEDKGARVLNAHGGVSRGTYFHPAVVYPAKPSMALWTVEQFGPIVPIAPFDDLSEPLRYVVDSSYGQQVSLFGRNPDALASLIDPLVNQVCRVNLNSQCQRGPDKFPFTGRKDSAEGTLSVSDALRVFSIRTLVAAKGQADNKALLGEILQGRRSKFLSTDFLF
jgi:glyceraldehyde-3-phosphate dehydrogenase (NADP+)